MAQTFNGATLTFTDSSSTPVEYKFNVRDFSEAGNDRAAIDFTTAASTRRQVVYGFAEATEFTILEGLLEQHSGTLAIAFIDDNEATPTDTFGGNRYAVVKGFTFSGEIDGVIVYSITFGILH